MPTNSGGEMLSQQEVESLLSAMDGASSPSLHLDRSRNRVIPYDFKRPERVGKEQICALQSLHEGFARHFGAALSGLLRTIVEFKLTSVDQLTYNEFVLSLENPTCCNVLKAQPLVGNLILDINPTVLYPVIDRLLGGGKETSASPSGPQATSPSGPQANTTRRPLTEIELRLVSRITTLFLRELQRAWETVLSLEVEVDRVESNPQLAPIVPPNEVVVAISFELTLGETRGMLNLCLPFNSIEPISGKLAANSWVSDTRATSTPESRSAISHDLDLAMSAASDQAVVEITATLAQTRISTGDLIGLRVGDIIATDKDKQSWLEVAVAGVSKFFASPGAMKGRKAIQIEQVLDPQTPAAQ